MENKNGYVYVLTNEAVPHHVKIGMTQRDDIFRRVFLCRKNRARKNVPLYATKKIGVEIATLIFFARTFKRTSHRFLSHSALLTRVSRIRWLCDLI